VPGAACLGCLVAVTVALPVSIPIAVAVAIPLTVALDELEQCVPEPLRHGQHAAESVLAVGHRQRPTQPDELAVAIGIHVAVRDVQGHGHKHPHGHSQSHGHKHPHGHRQSHGQSHGHKHRHSHEYRQRYHKPDPGEARCSRRLQPELGPEPDHQRQR